MSEAAKSAEHRLRRLLPGGTSVATTIVHRTAARRWVRLFVADEGQVEEITRSVATLLGLPYDEQRDAVRVKSTGGIDEGLEVTLRLEQAIGRSLRWKRL